VIRNEQTQSPPEPFTTTFIFDWKSPPLHLNQRWKHWAIKARAIKDVRSLMHAKARHIPELDRIDVHLVWVVATKHRRDGINSTPTLKALVDGLVDAEVIPDDTPEYLSDHIPEIRYEKGAVPHFEFTVKEVRA
jgi:crossover junction endodeoxyribonuclease RusA